MPYLHVRLSTPASPTLAAEVADLLTTATTRILGKRPEVTSISVEFVDPNTWFIDNKSLDASGRTSFYLEIKITDGSNTKGEKAAYVGEVFAAMQGLLGELAPASYIVIDDLRADAWGFGGRTQERRFVEAQPL